jgi:hypothetical protein
LSASNSHRIGAQFIIQRQEEHLSDEAKKADVGRRKLLLAGTALPVLSISGCGAQLQQAQAQAPTQSTAPAVGNVVMVDPSDTIVAIQTKLNSVPAGGTLAFPANSAFNFNGRTVRAKSGITILANGPVTINGAPGPGTAGAFDFGGMSNWTVRGKAPGQGFVFNSTLVNADSSTNGAVGCCIFNNAAANDLNGSAIRMTGASSLLVINNDFFHCGGNILGQYDWDNVTVDGNHFTGQPGQVAQLASIDNGTNPNRGRNILFTRNIYQNVQRTGIETGGDDDNGNGQVFTNFVIDNNWFADLVFPPGDGAAPVSVVARGAKGLKVTNNYFRRGNVNPGQYTEAIETASKVNPPEISGNLIVGFASPFAIYAIGANIHDNKVFNASNSIPAGNTVLVTRPADPPQPQRLNW